MKPSVVTGVLAIAFLAGQSSAQWTFSTLHPKGAGESVGYSASGGQQGGYVFRDGIVRAALWSGTAASWVDLNPVGSTDSVVSAIDGDQQVGYAWIGGQRAGLWSGTADS